MGGTISTDNIKNNITHDQLFNLVNEVASNYIFSSSFYDLRKSSDTEYCSKLTILTKDIIEKSLKQRNISTLHSKLYPNSNLNKEPVFFINKSTLDRVNKDTNSKQTLCRQIAKFYIKIYHLFLAIINVIKPSWQSNTSSSNQDTLPYDKYYERSRKDSSIKDNYTRKDKGFCVTQLLTLLGQDNLANIFSMESDKEFNVNINNELHFIQIVLSDLSYIHSIFLDVSDVSDVSSISDLNKPQSIFFLRGLFFFFVLFVDFIIKTT